MFTLPRTSIGEKATIVLSAAILFVPFFWT
jgi:hypothetical protein